MNARWREIGKKMLLAPFPRREPNRDRIWMQIVEILFML